MVIIINNPICKFIENNLLKSCTKATIYADKINPIRGYSDYVQLPNDMEYSKPIDRNVTPLDEVLSNRDNIDPVYASTYLKAVQNHDQQDCHIFNENDIMSCTYAMCSIADADVISEYLDGTNVSYTVVNFINSSNYIRRYAIDDLNAYDFGNDSMSENMNKQFSIYMSMIDDSDKLTDAVLTHALSSRLKNCVTIDVDKKLDWIKLFTDIIANDIKLSTSRLQNDLEELLKL